MTRKKSEFRYDYLIYGVFALFCLWLAIQVPYTFDDWDWGGWDGVLYLTTANINSRYVGNAFVFTMVRLEWLKVLIMAAGYFAVPYLLALVVERICGCDSWKLRVQNFVFANICMLTMHMQIWQQTYSWVAGFANYILSVVFMLLCFLEWAPLWAERCVLKEDTLLHSVYCFVLILCSQLFIENITLILMALSVLSCFLARKRAGKIPRRYLWMVLGAAVGMAIMFSSSIYTELAQTGKGALEIRELAINAEDGLMGSIYNVLYQCMKFLVGAGELNMVLSVSLLCLLTYGLYAQNLGITQTQRRILTGINALLCVYFVVSRILDLHYYEWRMVAAAAVNGFYFLIATLQLILITKADRRLFLLTGGIWLTAICLLAPLVFTNCYAGRIIYAFVILLLMLLLILRQEKYGSAMEKTAVKQRVLSLVCLAVLLGYYTVIYAGIGEYKKLRDEAITAGLESGSSVITIPRYPHEEYLWYPDPFSEKTWADFREFYGIPEDVEIRIV